MNLSRHNIHRITEWIHSKVNNNFINPGYTNDFPDDQVLLDQCP